MLNDPTWVEAARMLARRTLREQPLDLAEQLQIAFRRVLCRDATDAELERLKSAYHKQQAFYQTHPSAAQEWLSIGQSPADPDIDAVTLATLGNVCLAILNLDEAMTRQ
jgi:hypothetical protein